MTDPRPRASLAEHQLTVIRAFLRHRVPLAELIDRFDAEANAHRFTLDPRGTSTRTLLVPRVLLEDPTLASLLSEALVEALRRAGARPVTLSAKGIRY
jgi:hypothetical protein